MMTNLFAFAMAAVILALVPGPSTAVILRRSLMSGRRAGVAVVIGDDVGALIWGIGAAFGLSALLIASQVAYDTLRIVGVVVLASMGIRALWKARRGSAEPALTGVEPATAWRSFRLGLITNLANPKAGVFSMSFLPQFVPHDQPVLPTMLALSVLWALIDACWGLTLVWMAGRARHVLRRPRVRRRLERISGIVLIVLGLRLVTESR
jgi:threonine/homoserine/homoserine lactone efflux protein